MEPLPDIIEPRWWTGELPIAPDSFTIDCSGYTLDDAILATDFGQKLKELGLCYHRDLTDRDAFAGTEEIGVYNHWQKSMMTEDPDEAEQYARNHGLETEWGPNRLLKTRYYVSAYEYDEKALFVDIYDRYGAPINWNVGDVAIVCNWRWAHGRPSIHLKEGEQRELGVLIGAPFERVGDLDNKW